MNKRMKKLTKNKKYRVRYQESLGKIRARRNAYASYLDAANQYVVRKGEGAPADEIRQRARDISERHHPSVWAEMKRLSTIPAHSKFFQAAPELLSC